MDCKTTSTRTRRRRQAGWTLAEFAIGSGVASVLFMAVASLSLYSGRAFAAMTNYIDLDNYSRNALDRMSREIRQTQSLTSFSNTHLTFKDFDNGVLTYQYDPQARQLTRTKDGQSEVFLEECDFLKFSIYQRNPVNGTYDQYPTATATTCKLVQLSWICSRTILGAKINTESVQSAKIVIRKQ